MRSNSNTFRHRILTPAPATAEVAVGLAASALGRLARSVCSIGSICVAAMHESRRRHARQEIERCWHFLPPRYAETMLRSDNARPGS